MLVDRQVSGMTKSIDLEYVSLCSVVLFVNRYIQQWQRVYREYSEGNGPREHTELGPN